MRVVIYSRVSTADQVENGVSLDNQAAKTTAYAALHDLEIVASLSDDGVSAKSLNRPGLKAALAMLDDGRADGLLIYDLSRLTRNVGDWSKLIEGYFGGRVQLLSVHDHIDTRSAAGRLALNILLSVCQWQREYIAERTRDALSHVRKSKRLGAAPKHDKHAPLVRELRQSGLTIRQIADRLSVSKSTVARMAQ